MHLFHYDKIEKWWLYDSNEKPSKLSLELKQTQKLWINRRYIIILSDTRSNQIPTRSKKGKLNPNFDTIIKIQGKEAAGAERIGLSNFCMLIARVFDFDVARISTGDMSICYKKNLFWKMENGRFLVHGSYFILLAAQVCGIWITFM